MHRKLLRAKIHRATVTRSDLHYEGSIAIDETLMEAADLWPHEAVHVWNVTNGERLETYVIPAEKGSREICLNGAAARRAQPGDVVIIASFCWLEEEAARRHTPKIVMVDGMNHVICPRTENHGQTDDYGRENYLR
jgi:aspartate 1-decarboxylase